MPPLFIIFTYIYYFFWVRHVLRRIGVDNNGLVNRLNIHYFSDKNPYFYRTLEPQKRWFINVGGVIFGIKNHRPKFLTVIWIVEILDVFCVIIPRQWMWLQLDGATAHSTYNVRKYLDICFPNRWIGRSGRQHWLVLKSHSSKGWH